MTRFFCLNIWKKKRKIKPNNLCFNSSNDNNNTGDYCELNDTSYSMHPTFITNDVNSLEPILFSLLIIQQHLKLSERITYSPHLLNTRITEATAASSVCLIEIATRNRKETAFSRAWKKWGSFILTAIVCIQFYMVC